MHLRQDEKEEARLNLARCEEILECKRQIEFWNNRLNILKGEQDKRNKLAKLRLDARATWRTLTRKEKLEKEFVLAAMQSEELPAVLDDFPNSAFPPNIRLDRDILLARVARPDFADRYTDGERLFIPQKLRGDKEVIKAIVKRHPQVVECMACHLRDDEDILFALLENKVLPKFIMQHFSNRIRQDANLMFKVLQHPYGLPSLNYASQALRNDKEFLLKVLRQEESPTTSTGCGEEMQILKYVSHRLRADRDVVHESVRRSGLNLKHAAYSLRRDREVVLAACTKNESAFRYCLPCHFKDELVRDRKFILRALRNDPRPSMFRICLEHFKTDEHVLLQALEAGMAFADIPRHLRDDINFIEQALCRNPKIYLELPTEIRDRYDVALSAIQVHGVCDSVMLEVTQRVPDLIASRIAILSMAKNVTTDLMQDMLQFAPREIRSDKELMLEAVKNDSIALEHCGEELLDDRDIVKAAVESSPSSLYLVSERFQLENPDIVIAAIEKTDPEDLWSTYDDIYEGLWLNKDVAMAWLTAGGDWLDDDFLEEFNEDQELLLAVAEHNWTEFQYASDQLKANRDFMMKAVAKDGRVFKEVCDSLRHDFDLAIVAFSNSCQALQFFEGAEDFEFMVTFSRKVSDRLAEHDIFVNHVLCAMAGGSHGRCCLPMLNQGPDTCLGREIASYLGLPQAKELSDLRMVSRHLLHWGM